MAVAFSPAVSANGARSPRFPLFLSFLHSFSLPHILAGIDTGSSITEGVSHLHDAKSAPASHFTLSQPRARTHTHARVIRRKEGDGISLSQSLAREKGVAHQADEGRRREGVRSAAACLTICCPSKKEEEKRRKETNAESGSRNQSRTQRREISEESASNKEQRGAKQRQSD